MGKKKFKLIHLLCKSGKNVRVYSPTTYGCETWGSTSQDSIEKKRKYWYICSWTSGNEWFDDITFSYKLNVILETQDVKELLKYVKNNYPHCLESVKDDCENIQETFNKILSWGK